jgi:hypothetical protein
MGGTIGEYQPVIGLKNKADYNDEVKKILNEIESGKINSQEAVDNVLLKLEPYRITGWTENSRSLFYRILDEGVSDNIIAEAITGDTEHSSGYFTGIKSKADAYNLFNVSDGYGSLSDFQDSKI